MVTPAGVKLSEHNGMTLELADTSSPLPTFNSNFMIIKDQKVMSEEKIVMTNIMEENDNDNGNDEEDMEIVSNNNDNELNSLPQERELCNSLQTKANEDSGSKKALANITAAPITAAPITTLAIDCKDEISTTTKATTTKATVEHDDDNRIPIAAITVSTTENNGGIHSMEDENLSNPPIQLSNPTSISLELSEDEDIIESDIENDNNNYENENERQKQNDDGNKPIDNKEEHVSDCLHNSQQEQQQQNYHQQQEQQQKHQQQQQHSNARSPSSKRPFSPSTKILNKMESEPPLKCSRLDNNVNNDDNNNNNNEQDMNNEKSNSGLDEEEEPMNIDNLEVENSDNALKGETQIVEDNSLWSGIGEIDDSTMNDNESFGQSSYNSLEPTEYEESGNNDNEDDDEDESFNSDGEEIIHNDGGTQDSIIFSDPPGGTIMNDNDITIEPIDENENNLSLVSSQISEEIQQMEVVAVEEEELHSNDKQSNDSNTSNKNATTGFNTNNNNNTTTTTTEPNLSSQETVPGLLESEDQSIHKLSADMENSEEGNSDENPFADSQCYSTDPTPRNNNNNEILENEANEVENVENNDDGGENNSNVNKESRSNTMNSSIDGETNMEVPKEETIENPPSVEAISCPTAAEPPVIVDVDIVTDENELQEKENYEEEDFGGETQIPTAPPSQIMESPATLLPRFSIHPNRLSISTRLNQIHQEQVPSENPSLESLSGLKRAQSEYIVVRGSNDNDDKTTKQRIPRSLTMSLSSTLNSDIVEKTPSKKQNNQNRVNPSPFHLHSLPSGTPSPQKKSKSTATTSATARVIQNSNTLSSPPRVISTTHTTHNDNNDGMDNNHLGMRRTSSCHSEQGTGRLSKDNDMSIKDPHSHHQHHQQQAQQEHQQHQHQPHTANYQQNENVEKTPSLPRFRTNSDNNNSNNNSNNNNDSINFSTLQTPIRINIIGNERSTNGSVSTSLKSAGYTPVCAPPIREKTNMMELSQENDDDGEIVKEVVLSLTASQQDADNTLGNERRIQRWGEAGSSNSVNGPPSLLTPEPEVPTNTESLPDNRPRVTFEDVPYHRQHQQQHHHQQQQQQEDISGLRELHEDVEKNNLTADTCFGPTALTIAPIEDLPARSLNERQQMASSFLNSIREAESICEGVDVIGVDAANEIQDLLVKMLSKMRTFKPPRSCN
eukprot:TRINITY_DN2791_c0_g2_i1.p1 TRINITY_DN2791_c0_g2~~TRINITY_DN2791_c0_g2_i1.p1  ORF type:complete len:1334 (+),score=520.89 TRINITY_DN2791_c0_g2_i1:459-4004(+)